MRSWLVLAIVLLLGVAAAWYGTQQEARLYALDAASGRIVWSAAVGGESGFSTVVSGGQVYVWSGGFDERNNRSGETARLRVFDATTGVQHWTFTPAAPVDASEFGFLPLTATPQTVITVVEERSGHLQVVALDAVNGVVRWKQTIADDRRLRGSPVLLGADVVLASVADVDVGNDSVSGPPTRIERRNGVTGALLWEATFPIPSRRIGTPDAPIAGANTTALVLATIPPLVIDAATGRVLRTIDGAGRAYAVLEETVFAMTDRATEVNAPPLSAFDLASGQPRWSYAFTDSVEPLLRASEFATLSAAQAGIYGTVDIVRPGVNETSVTSDPARDSFLVALNSTDGALRWYAQYDTTPELPLPWRSPPLTVADVVVVLRSGQMLDGLSALAVYSADDGHERWVFPVRLRSLGQDVLLIASDAQQIFVVDNAPRWRTWLASINQNWR